MWVSRSHYQQNNVLSTATITYVLFIQYKQRTHTRSNNFWSRFSIKNVDFIILCYLYRKSVYQKSVMSLTAVWAWWQQQQQQQQHTLFNGVIGKRCPCEMYLTCGTWAGWCDSSAAAPEMRSCSPTWASAGWACAVFCQAHAGYVPTHGCSCH